MLKDQAIHNLCPTTVICKNIYFNIDFEEVLFANFAKIFQKIVFKTHYKESGNTLTCTIDTKRKFCVSKMTIQVFVLL